MKKVLAIIGSTRANSSNLKLIQEITGLASEKYKVTVFEGLSGLPHFNPDLDTENPPTEIVNFRQLIAESDGVIICTPEYVFSLPGSLKNAIEWCVSTTIFSQKPVGLITASASGEKGHEELKLVMKTVEARFSAETALLIRGVKGKFNGEGRLTDSDTVSRLRHFVNSFDEQLYVCSDVQ